MALNHARFLKSSRILPFTPAGRMRYRQSPSRKVSLPIVRSGSISFLPLRLRRFRSTKKGRQNEQRLWNSSSVTSLRGIVQYTTDVLFRDLWLRPDLAPRDRSLVTVSTLIASGQVAQITYHLNRAMDNGLTQTQAAEMVTHLAFYAGWPNAFSALPVLKDVFEKRPR